MSCYLPMVCRLMAHSVGTVNGVVPQETPGLPWGTLGRSGKVQDMSPVDTGKSMNAQLRRAIFPGRRQDGAVPAAFQLIYTFF